MKRIKILTIMVLVIIMCSAESYARKYFNKNNDLLIAQFDSKPDPDDIHSIAALGCILAHSDFNSINYFAVAGAYGWQGGGYIHAPNLFNMAFGTKNTNWTDAHNERNASITRIKNKAKAVLQAGGNVFVQEAGQSDITRDWCQALLNDGVAWSKVKNNVIVVQHSAWNEDKTTGADLTWVKNNTTYTKIADGNGSGNGTPGYRSTNKDFLNRAKSSQNAKAKSLWIEADRVIQANGHLPSHSSITVGGVDFSDCVENWWILSLGNAADNVSKFWSKYVTNAGTVTPRSPYGGSPRSIPGTIQVEEYDHGGEGVAYHDNDATNHGPNVMREDEGVDIEARDGGKNIGWTANGEWVEHTVNVSAGTYDIEARVATTSTGKSVLVKLNGSNLGTFNCPNTGGWGTFQTIKISGVNVSGGNGKILRTQFVGGGVNLNWIKFTAAGGGGGGQSKTVTLAPIHDSYLQNSSNFNNTLLRVESGRRVSYLMYDLSSINGNITAASLKLTCNGDNGNGVIKIDKGNSTNWTESNLSNSNKPSSAGQLATKNSSYNLHSAYTWNLSTGSLSGGGKLSLIISQTSGGDVAFASKENSATEPQLVVTYTTPKSAIAAGEIAKTVDNQSLLLYPNPAYDYVNVEFVSNIEKDANFQLIDLTGKVILNSHWQTVQGLNTKSLEINHIPSGTYFVKIHTGDNVLVKKLVK